MFRDLFIFLWNGLSFNFSIIYIIYYRKTNWGWEGWEQCTGVLNHWNLEHSSLPWEFPGPRKSSHTAPAQMNMAVLSYRSRRKSNACLLSSVGNQDVANPTALPHMKGFHACPLLSFPFQFLVAVMVKAENMAGRAGDLSMQIGMRWASCSLSVSLSFDPLWNHGLSSPSILMRSGSFLVLWPLSFPLFWSFSGFSSLQSCVDPRASKMPVDSVSTWCNSVWYNPSIWCDSIWCNCIWCDSIHCESIRCNSQLVHFMKLATGLTWLCLLLLSL